MFRKYKKMLLITSLLIFLPALLGLLLWTRLPDTLVTHWGMDGTADGFMPKGIAIFILPLCLLPAHWLCIWVTTLDKQNENQNEKVMKLVMWLMPVMSLCMGLAMWQMTVSGKLSADYTMLLIGIVFIVIGNLLPKCRRNSTIGIKVKWALADDENWAATHRFGGRLWVAGGFLLLPAAFLPIELAVWSIVIILTAMAVLPIIYSWRYYKKQLSQGKSPAVWSRFKSKSGTASLIIVALTALLIIALSCTGSISMEYGDKYFTVSATYWEDLGLHYGDIQSVEYVQAVPGAARTMGFGSPRLALGNFSNSEYGAHIRYRWGNFDGGVLVRTEQYLYVISLPTEAETIAVYEALLERTGG